VKPANIPRESRETIARLAEFRLTLLRFERASDRIVRRCGLAPRQYVLLLTLEGPRGGGASIGTLSEDLGLAQSTVAELVDRSEAKGIVRREPSRRDGRVVLIRTTDEGRRLLARALAALDVERELLGSALERIAAALPVPGVRGRLGLAKAEDG
jgi:DNA-binding MarR family transcriptional regulator